MGLTGSKDDGADGAFITKLRNVEKMVAESGYDVIIVCTSDDQQAAYWQSRLEQAKGSVTPSSATILAVDEDWPGGAGNFLGTLYAWRKACTKHQQMHGTDLLDKLKGGASVAIFHTAGKGTRMAPLPGSENNNKPGVKLPVPGSISILESVIRQTGAYAKSRKTRLSVFWGDQVFVPSVSVEYTPEYHADIMCGLGAMPDSEEWARRGLDKYGLIAARDDLSVVMQLEKVTHEQASAQLAGKDDVSKVGTSLGSFSLSASFLETLDKAFDKELGEKAGKLDSDPHLWMPMTCSEDNYVKLMLDKKLFDEAGAREHHKRVAAILSGFDTKTDGHRGMFGAVSVGLDLSWWDYGLLKLYRQNSLLLTQDGEDAKLARQFYGVPDDARQAPGCVVGSCTVDSASVLSRVTVSNGSITGSCLAKVCAKEIQAQDAVIANCCAKKIVAGKGALAYNLNDNSEEGITLGENEVRVGIFTCDPKRPYFEMRSNVADIDGGKVFKDKVCNNDFSFQEVYDLNMGADVLACEAKATAAFEASAKSFA